MQRFRRNSSINVEALPVPPGPTDALPSLSDHAAPPTRSRAAASTLSASASAFPGLRRTQTTSGVPDPYGARTPRNKGSRNSRSPLRNSGSLDSRHGSGRSRNGNRASIGVTQTTPITRTVSDSLATNDSQHSMNSNSNLTDIALVQEEDEDDEDASEYEDALFSLDMDQISHHSSTSTTSMKRESEFELEKKRLHQLQHDLDTALQQVTKLKQDNRALLEQDMDQNFEDHITVPKLQNDIEDLQEHLTTLKLVNQELRDQNTTLAASVRAASAKEHSSLQELKEWMKLQPSVTELELHNKELDAQVKSIQTKHDLLVARDAKWTHKVALLHETNTTLQVRLLEE